MQKLPVLKPATAGNAFALPLSLGNIEAYINLAGRYPLLSQEEEMAYAKNYRDNGDVDAAKKLVLSHLRLVVSLARGYLGYGLPHADLIQEGNIGLMKAVKRFDPSLGARLFSYAIHWIRAEIHAFILKNWRLVKITSTKANSKLFFNLRSLKADLDCRGNLDNNQASQIAETLGVKKEEVLDMEMRFSAHEIALYGDDDSDSEMPYAPIHYLADNSSEPLKVLENKEFGKLCDEKLYQALDKLDPRSREVIKARWLTEDQSSTLHELAATYSVSHERIRQIEVSAMQKLKKALIDHR